ncbi:MAG TPA: PadR family transcriptional regulator [Actinobacteria bacterium]|jgi:DNA-binding PadR family transcriptional regulator|nr:PadR family transcriptional regulator [Actinomycetota bacterium]
MAKRTDVLDHTVLGVLSDGPLHGYELRKRLTAILGPFRALSFGSLYPCLHRLTDSGLIEQIDAVEREEIVGVSTKRARIVYALTAEGKEAFAAWVADTGPEAWEDEAFAARMAFFSRTEAAVRLRILEGRRARLEERLSSLQSSIDRTNERMDIYAERLQRHGIEGAEREVGWLEELIATERDARQGRREARAVKKAVKKAARKQSRGTSTSMGRKKA